jgi:hypothetical protein
MYEGYLCRQYEEVHISAMQITIVDAGMYLIWIESGKLGGELSSMNTMCKTNRSTCGYHHILNLESGTVTNLVLAGLYPCIWTALFSISDRTPRTPLVVQMMSMPLMLLMRR